MCVHAVVSFFMSCVFQQLKYVLFKCVMSINCVRVNTPFVSRQGGAVAGAGGAGQAALREAAGGEEEKAGGAEGQRGQETSCCGGEEAAEAGGGPGLPPLPPFHSFTVTLDRTSRCFHECWCVCERRPGTRR